MFGFFKKYRLGFKILAALFFVFSCYMYLQEYFTEAFETPKEKKLKLIFGIIIGLMAVFQLGDVIEILKSRKKKTVE
jgi:hypothetical protein